MIYRQRTARSRLLFAVALLAWASAARAQTPTSQERSSAEIEAQIISLQAELKAKKVVEARAAIAAEAEAKVKAAEARIYLASVGDSSVPFSNVVAGDAASDASDEATDGGGTVTTTTTKPDGTKVVEMKPYSDVALRDNTTGKQKFGGIEFGLGIAFTYDWGDNDRVTEADLIDGIVRVTDRDNARARILLESHFLFTPNNRYLGTRTLGLENTDKKKTWGFGPFIALQPGTEDFIEAVGAGIMVGFRRAGSESESFNLGFGVLYDLNTRILGEGIEANRPLPGGETAIRYLEQEQSGLLIMSSYSF